MLEQETRVNHAPGTHDMNLCVLLRINNLTRDLLTRMANIVSISGRAPY